MSGPLGARSSGGSRRSAALEKRIEVALEKHDCGEPLTETEMRIVYWIRYSAGCHACGSSPGVQVAVSRDSKTVSAVERSI